MKKVIYTTIFGGYDNSINYPDSDISIGNTLIGGNNNTIIKDTKIKDQKLLDKNQLSEYEKLKKKYPNSIKDGF